MSILDINSVIPNGLRLDVFRKRIEDKNSLNVKGSIYVGIGTNTPYTNVNSQDQSAVVYTTSVISPVGLSGKAFCSNGVGQFPSYKELQTTAFLDSSIKTAKIADNTITDSKIAQNNLFTSHLIGFDVIYSKTQDCWLLTWGGKENVSA